MDITQLIAVFFLSALACGRNLNDEHSKRNHENGDLPPMKSPSDFGNKVRENNLDNFSEFISETTGFRTPLTSSSKVVKKVHKSLIHEYDEPEQMEEIENGNDEFDQVRKTVNKVSTVSLKTKERKDALDPVSYQQNHNLKRIVRPMRDLSIIIRNPQHSVLITRPVYSTVPRTIPVGWFNAKRKKMKHHINKKPCKPSIVHESSNHPDHSVNAKNPKSSKELKHLKDAKNSKESRHLRDEVVSSTQGGIPVHKNIYYAASPYEDNHFYKMERPHSQRPPLKSTHTNHDKGNKHHSTKIDYEPDMPLHQEEEDHADYRALEQSDEDDSYE